MPPQTDTDTDTESSALALLDGPLKKFAATRFGRWMLAAARELGAPRSVCSALVLVTLLLTAVLLTWLGLSIFDIAALWFAAMFIVLFVVISAVWWRYIAIVSRDIDDTDDDEHFNIFVNLWFYILVLGLAGSFATAISKFGSEPQHAGFLQYFLETQIYTVFSVVMAALLADFVIVALARLKGHHKLL